MDYDFLAQRLQAWLAPEDILAAAAILASDREAAFKPSALVLASPWLRPEQDGGLRAMCEAYLQRFHISPDVVRIVKHTVYPDSGAYDWEALLALRYRGEVVVPQRTEALPDGMLEVRERSVVVDLLAQPLKGLQGMIATAAKAWSEVARTDIPKENFYHRHRAPEPFLVWLDAEVGRIHGFCSLGKPNLTQHASGPNIRYRAVTVTNFRQSSGALLNAIKQIAVHQARSTWEPI
jgi:hypothetical protein